MLWLKTEDWCTFQAGACIQEMSGRITMTVKWRLSADDKKFFKLVQGAALVNPFTAERSRINRQLSGLPDDHSEVEHNQKGV